MVKRLLVLPLALCLALGVATGAHAQTGNPSGSEDATVLPVWTNSNGKLEAVLLLVPTQPDPCGARWR